jgi:hypothetical protein
MSSLTALRYLALANAVLIALDRWRRYMEAEGIGAYLQLAGSASALLPGTGRLGAGPGRLPGRGGTGPAAAAPAIGLLSALLGRRGPGGGTSSAGLGSLLSRDWWRASAERHGVLYWVAAEVASVGDGVRAGKAALDPETPLTARSSLVLSSSLRILVPLLLRGKGGSGSRWRRVVSAVLPAVPALIAMAQRRGGGSPGPLA